MMARCALASSDSTHSGSTMLGFTTPTSAGPKLGDTSTRTAAISRGCHPARSRRILRDANAITTSNPSVMASHAYRSSRPTDSGIAGSRTEKVRDGACAFDVGVMVAAGGVAEGDDPTRGIPPPRDTGTDDGTRTGCGATGRNHSSAIAIDASVASVQSHRSGAPR